MRYGAKSAAVRVLQTALLARGLSPGPLDSVLGPKTWAALETAGGRALSRDWPVPADLLAELLSPSPDGWHETRGDQLVSVARRGRITMQVIHESVTTSADATVSVLKARELGVQYIVDTDATITQHVPEHRASYHAGDKRINDESIAIEVVNIYYGHRASAGADTLRGIWVDIAKQKDGTIRNPNKIYVIPPLVQLEAVHGLSERIFARHPSIPYELTRRFPSGGKHFYWGRWASGMTAGISAHHRWGHADGLFVEHYLECRAHGLDPAAAYLATIAAASSGQRRTTLPRAA